MRITKYCLSCDKEFNISPSRDKIRKFCSRKCKHEYGRRNKKCEICGKKFIVKKSHYNFRKCCSKECGNEYKRRYKSGKNHHQWKERINKICKQCNKNYKILPCISNTSIFCSKKCYSKYLSIHMCGEDNPAWKGGVRYPYNGKYKEFVKSIYKRDNYRCRLCGDTNKLNAHHIYPKSEYPELIYDIDNGITLCQDCHDYFRGVEKSFIDFFERLRGELNGRKTKEWIKKC